MRPSRPKAAGNQHVSTEAVVTQHDTGGIVALAAQAQQVLVQALRQTEFAEDCVMERLPIRNVKELRGRAEPLPQLSCASISVTHLRRRLAFDKAQCSAQRAPELELLPLTFGGFRQPGQLVQSLL